MKYFFPILIVLAGCTRLLGHASPDESILSDLEILKDSISSLEKRMERMEARLSEPGILASPAESATNAGLILRLADAVNRQEVLVHYPWMEASLWEKIKLGMSEEAVVAILGEPTLTDPSLSKRVDEVFTYRATHPATAQRVLGKVKFYRGQVIDIEAPSLD